MKLRTLLFWPHLIAGVLAGLVILLMCVTGVLLTYERQLIAWSDSHLRSAVPTDGRGRMPLNELIDAVIRQQPDVTPTAITVGSASDAPVTLSLGQRTLFVDAYSGQVLGEGSRGMRRAMSELRAWHRWLAIEGEQRGTARAITGWANVLFAFIVLSGMYLWLPRVWSSAQVRAVALFRGDLRGKARDFNWHNVIGIWSAIPLFIVVVSAVPISFPWGNALVYRMVGEEPPGREGGAGRAGRGGARGAEPSPDDRLAAMRGLNPLLARAEQQAPGWKTINVRPSTSQEGPVVFAIDRGDGGQPQLRSTLTLSRSGEVQTYESFSSLTLGRRIRNVMRFAHTGEVLGLPGQTVAGVVSAGGMVLVWTGLALAWRRFRTWVKRRRDSRHAEPVVARSSAA